MLQKRKEEPKRSLSYGIDSDLTSKAGIPVWVSVVVIAALGMVINIVGIKTASIIDTVITCAAIGFTVLFVICVIKYVSGGGGADACVSAPRRVRQPAGHHAGDRRRDLRRLVRLRLVL